jgi:hypothetical protein
VTSDKTVLGVGRTAGGTHVTAAAHGKRMKKIPSWRLTRKVFGGRSPAAARWRSNGMFIGVIRRDHSIAMGSTFFQGCCRMPYAVNRPPRSAYSLLP